MLNLFLLLFHLFLLTICSFWAARLGKEALITLVCLMAVMANLFVLKQTFLGPLTITCSDAFAVGISLNLNLLQTSYGKKSANQAVFLSFLSLLFFGIMSQFHLLYLPASQDQYDGLYTQLFSVTPRLLLASIIAFALSQQIDVHGFHFISKLYPQLSWKIRNMLTITFSQAVDTLLFTLLGLYGVLSPLLPLMLMSYSVKLLLVFLLPFLHSIPKEKSFDV